MEFLIKKILYGGKNGQQMYWLKSYLRYFSPVFNREEKLEKLIAEAESRPDYQYIKERVDFYNLLNEKCLLPETTHTIGDYKLDKNVRRRLMTNKHDALAKTYFFDSNEILRWFDKNLKFGHMFGDNIDALPYPMITKTRPIEGDNMNDVLLKLDKNRHFIYLRDDIKFEDKKDILVSRCCINGQPQRLGLFKKYFGVDWCDMGYVGNDPVFTYPPEWRAPKISLYEHLKYKFITCFEGNDVASNLKWVMSSNSLAVTNKPKYESWFMESKLIPDYHYICVEDDLSNLKEKLDFYIAHPDLSKEIARHANEYVAQFKDSRREFLIGILVMKKYFEMTSQC